MAEGERIIGIDLGTTNSVVAVMDGSDVTVIANQEGSLLTPSVVAFTPKGETLVGEPARRQAVTNPAGTVFSVKRFMGLRHDEAQNEASMVPYQVVGEAGGFVKVRVRGKEYTPPQISAMILTKLKEAAETYLGHRVRKAVITVPVYLNYSQRQAIKDASLISGLEMARLINAPTAAALGYGLDKKQDEKIAVFDLGGGTFGISILDIGDGVFEVLATSGDTHLGGDDWDKALLTYIAEEFKKKLPIDLRSDPMALQRLKEAAEKAKQDLSFQTEAEIHLPFITTDHSGPKHLSMTISRSQFERLTDSLFERCKAPVLRALEDARLKAADIDRVVLVGGSTRMPRVQQIVKEIFGKDPYKGVNPDEVVAVGAAIEGAILTGEVHHLRLLDVAPLSLGLATKGGKFVKLVERNTTIPTEKKETFTTADDNQTAVAITVFQGERPMAADNRRLGEFQLEGIPPARAGKPQIEVAFDIDGNGILNVTARDKGTNRAQSIRIESAGGQKTDDIENRLHARAATDIVPTFPQPPASSDRLRPDPPGPGASSGDGPDRDKPRVFVSHSTHDRKFVEREIIPVLKKHGIDTWYSKDDILGAEEWERSIRKGLQSCDWFLIVMSPRAADSPWVKTEVRWAFRNRSGRILPVLYEPCETEDFHLGMPDLQHIDFSVNVRAARSLLSKVCAESIRPSASHPRSG